MKKLNLRIELAVVVLVALSLFLFTGSQVAMASDSTRLDDVEPPNGEPSSIMTDCNTITEISKAECEALVALYDSTNGGSWTDHTNWKTNNTPCDSTNGWYGLTCDGGHITQVIMEYNNLSGTLPSTIGNLTSLQLFDMAMNSITGSIPDSFGNMTNLTMLALNYNSLTGSIPAAFGNLSNLQALLLYSNSLSGLIPSELENLTNLTRLELGGNGLTGNIPPGVWNLTKLERLDLRINHLTGHVPTEIGNLVNLTALLINNNSEFTGALPLSLTSLTKLDTFWYNSTALCAPQDAAFQTWLSTISNKNVTWNCLAAPAKTSPVNNTFTKDTTPKFTWVKQMNGEKYQITVDNNSDFSSPVFNPSGLFYPYKTFTTALAQGIYYWRVRAKDPGGNWSPWSTKWKFTVDTTPPGKPTLLSPTNGSNITDRTPTFTWKAVTGAKYYQLVVDDTANFSSPVFTSAWMTGTSKTLGTALAPKLYYWRVKAKDAAGNLGAWSAVWKVTIK